MGKAKGDYTRPRAAIQKAAPEHDDTRWVTLKAAHQRGAERTLDNELALAELMQALERDRLPSMHQSATGKRTRLRHTIWTERLMPWFGKDGLRVTPRPQPGDPGFPNIVRPFPGWFFVWEPALDRIWSTTQPTRRETREPAGAPPKFKPEQQQWLQNKYSNDLMAEPRLAKHDAAVPHVKELAKTNFEIEVGRNTLLQQIIRPVLRAAKNNQ